MDKHEISELAHKAARSKDSRLLGCGVDDLERFALLAAAAEREACASEADHWQQIENRSGHPRPHQAGAYIAAAIRGRSNYK